MTEDYPVHEELDVIDGETVFHNEDWWKAVVAYESWGGVELAVYLWQNTDKGWSRKQKFKIGDQEEWQTIKQEIENLASEHL